MGPGRGLLETCTPMTAQFDAVVELDAAAMRSPVTWGTSLRWCGRGCPRARPRQGKGRQQTRRPERALTYGAPVSKPHQRHHHGKGLHRLVHQQPASRTCARPLPYKNLGQKVARNVKRWWSRAGLVGEQAEREGLDQIFTAAGFEWREPGCSMCLAMNADRLEPGEQRCASTSNRNFEGRQAPGRRTHLVSPAMAPPPPCTAILSIFAHSPEPQL